LSDVSQMRERVLAAVLRSLESGPVRLFRIFAGRSAVDGIGALAGSRGDYAIIRHSVPVRTGEMAERLKAAVC
jgi:hypothetical protein